MLQETPRETGEGRSEQSRIPAESRELRAQNFWRNVQRLDAGAQICRQGQLAGAESVAVVSGWACELQLLPDGRRQIFGFVLPQEIVDLPAARLRRCDLVALTRVQVVDWAHGLRELGDAAKSWARTAQERHDRFFDHMVRLGRLTAEERVLNLLVDFHHRLSTSGLVKGNAFKLPLTQELMADALGLSIVHINRTIQKLRGKGYITLESGVVTLHDPGLLAHLACYSPVREVSAPPPEARSWRAVV